MFFRRKTRIRSKKISAIRRRRRVIRLLVLFTFFAILFGAVFSLTRYQGLHIEDVSVSGVLTSEARETLSRLAREELLGAHIFIFPKRHTLWYPKGSIEETILASDARFEGVSISRDGLKGLHIVVVEREPFALWCTKEEKRESEEAVDVSGEMDEKCFYMDEKAVVYAPAPLFGERVYIRHYGAMTDERVLGASFMNEEEFSTLSVFLEFLTQRGFTPQRVDTQSESDRAIILEGEVELRMKRDADTLTILDAFETTLTSDALKEIEFADLSYIDFRFGNRVYYKEKGDEDTPEPAYIDEVVEVETEEPTEEESEG